MKIVVLKNHLQFGLDVIGKIGAESNSATLPILKNFLIETINNSLILSVTNLEIAITNFIPAKVVERGSLTVPFSIFNSIINNIQDERINIETDGNQIIIKTDNYQAKIQGNKKDDFPIIPQVNSEIFFEISTSIFKKSLSMVNIASQISEIKPELSGVLFDYQVNLLKLVSTDSFRLAEKNIINTQFKSNIEKNLKIIIPLKTIQEVVRIFKDDEDKITIYFDKNQILFKTESSELISRLISGDFPDYQSIIPQSFSTDIILNREQLINSLKLTSSFTDRLNEIKFSAKENTKNIEIYSSSQILGENQYLIPSKIKGNNLEIIFNWRFLLDGVKIIDSENVFLGFNGDNKPVLIKSPGDVSYFYILMPIKSS